MNATPEPTRVTEDYLAVIWKASEWPDDGHTPATSAIASALGVSLSTVSAQLKRLATDGLIDYHPYGAIALTPEGETIARQVVRRHRILETFLVEHLGLAWDEVHEEADKLEHATSDRLIARMDDMLGHPAVDPHGDPIPCDIHDAPDPGVPLTRCERGESVVISRVSDENPDILRYCAKRTLAPGTRITILEEMDSTGLMSIEGGGQRVELSAQIANAIRAVPESA